MDIEFDIKENVLTQEKIEKDCLFDLMVYNDDFNTFEHVIDTLISICKHSEHQAEQCTYLIHYKGKCSVKKGSFDELKPMHTGITEAGIKASIV